ncbi:16S rRNA (uracil(1498)-N(3))-methyltransferase [Catenulispora sp. NL8]|uniref:Ribosomal RNA small subunit methyltransferase E n=1 Tax=Catenulispora pinistramenti TaxID=2705254 RepID=A0ABS5KTU2_9ACTN|nr:16S rRNA (uracil(1498)-N(3))-methyltransferase [Catenulispora pinistramenti]MBS2549473.1 16S rRNA (uracil(1498)-N(3))-methyltransferase [Catenulispora pinistramenti]
MSTAPVFFWQDTETAGRGARVRLDGAEGRHAALVRRLAAGERVDLANGAGVVAECVVAVAHKDWLELDVRDVVRTPAPTPRITVVQALPKGDRGETAVETMTEIGVDAVVPWAASRSIVQWKGERGEKALNKWRATAREAAKQSRRAWWPTVAALHSTAEVVKLLAEADQALVLHEDAQTPLAGLEVAHAGSVVLVIGPEGSIAPQELAAFEAAGARAYKMGPTVLRTSTAGTAAATVVLAKSGRWG